MTNIDRARRLVRVGPELLRVEFRPWLVCLLLGAPALLAVVLLVDLTAGHRPAVSSFVVLLSVLWLPCHWALNGSATMDAEGYRAGRLTKAVPWADVVRVVASPSATSLRLHLHGGGFCETGFPKSCLEDVQRLRAAVTPAPGRAHDEHDGSVGAD